MSLPKSKRTSKTIFELVEDEATWAWVFENIVKWEDENFPLGCRATREDFDEFKPMQKKFRYHALLAWTLTEDGVREFSGMASWYFDKNRTVFINNVFVMPKFHRRGIARDMLILAHRIISQRDKRIVRIWVVENNEPMLKLQRELMSNGFYQLEKPSNYWLDYYGDGVQRQYIEFRGGLGLTLPTTLS